jgi:hypothetical protein
MTNTLTPIDPRRSTEPAGGWARTPVRRPGQGMGPTPEIAGQGGGAGIGEGGSAGSAAVGGLIPGFAPPQFTEIATQSDPRLERQAARIEGRQDQWADLTGRQTEAAASKRRALTEGQVAALGASGVSSIPGMGRAALERQEASDITGLTRDISLGREEDLDKYTLEAMGALGAPGEARRAERGQAMSAYDRQLAAWDAAVKAQLERERMSYEQLNAQLMALNQALSLA